jgi:hypothetical protein
MIAAARSSRDAHADERACSCAPELDLTSVLCRLRFALRHENTSAAADPRRGCARPRSPLPYLAFECLERRPPATRLYVETAARPGMTELDTAAPPLVDLLSEDAERLGGTTPTETDTRAWSPVTIACPAGAHRFPRAF